MELSFELASTSRLPKWIELPESYERNQFKLKIDYYLNSSGGEAIFNLLDEKGKTLKVVKGSILRKPLTLKKQLEGYSKGYPKFQIITINGITDVIEHKKMESKFYMADDSDVLKEFGVNQDDGHNPK